MSWELVLHQGLTSWQPGMKAAHGAPLAVCLTGGREQGSIQQMPWSRHQKSKHGQRKAGVGGWGGAELSVFQKPKGTDGAWEGPEWKGIDGPEISNINSLLPTNDEGGVWFPRPTYPPETWCIRI